MGDIIGILFFSVKQTMNEATTQIRDTKKVNRLRKKRNSPFIVILRAILHKEFIEKESWESEKNALDLIQQTKNLLIKLGG